MTERSKYDDAVWEALALYILFSRLGYTEAEIVPSENGNSLFVNLVIEKREFIVRAGTHSRFPIEIRGMFEKLKQEWKGNVITESDVEEILKTSRVLETTSYILMCIEAQGFDRFTLKAK